VDDDDDERRAGRRRAAEGGATSSARGGETTGRAVERSAASVYMSVLLVRALVVLVEAGQCGCLSNLCWCRGEERERGREGERERRGEREASRYSVVAVAFRAAPFCLPRRSGPPDCGGGLEQRHKHREHRDHDGDHGRHDVGGLAARVVAVERANAYTDQTKARARTSEQRNAETRARHCATYA